MGLRRHTHTHCQPAHSAEPAQPLTAHTWRLYYGRSVWDDGREPWGTDRGFRGPGAAGTHKPWGKSWSWRPGGPWRSWWSCWSCWSGGSCQAVLSRSTHGTGVSLASLHRWGENVITLGHQGGCQLNPEAVTVSPTSLCFLQSFLQICKAIEIENVP